MVRIDDGQRTSCRAQGAMAAAESEELWEEEEEDEECWRRVNDDDVAVSAGRRWWPTEPLRSHARLFGWSVRRVRG